MTVPSRARRHAANVEVMRLETMDDLGRAKEWLHEHGVESARSFVDPRLVIFAPNSVRLTARLGQVLTYDPDLREFAVLDVAVYDKTHTAAQGVADRE